MKALRCLVLGVIGAVLSGTSLPADGPPSPTPKEALQACNDLIGTWRGTGVPAGSREKQQQGFWVENITWQWQFKGTDTWLRVDFDKGKYFQTGQLRYLPDKKLYQLTLQTTAKKKQIFTGKLGKKVLTLERDGDGEKQRLVITLLHSDRFLYRLETQAPGKTVFSRRYQVGATREGVSFAAGDGKPECIVSGGLGTIALAYKGQTYYVCCSGCRAEFFVNPEKYIKEFQARKNKTKK